jgi:hypothetical protein
MKKKKMQQFLSLYTESMKEFSLKTGYSFRWSRNPPHSMKLEKSLPCTQETATVPADQPAEFGKFTICSTLNFSSYEH